MQPVRDRSSTADQIVDVVSGRELAAAVRAGDAIAEHVVGAHLERIARIDQQLRSLVLVDADRALTQARAIDERRRSGARLGVLAGLPVVVKDNIDVLGETTACGSLAHSGDLATRHATVVRRLLDADAVLIGRANMDEFAMGASTQTSAFGATRNPWDARRSPGGSSGGCAAAVAAGLAVLAVGTDTGGSIREPAAQCGVVGLAPSVGLVSVDGVVPFTPALDRLGPLAGSVEDAALALSVLAGRRLSRGRPVRRVGVIGEFAGTRNHPGVLDRLEQARSLLAALGIETLTVSVPDAQAALRSYMQVTSAASVPVLDGYVRTGRAGGEVVRRHGIGLRLLGPDRGVLDEALELQRRLTRQCAAALAGCDVLLSPTMPTTAPLLTARTSDDHDASSREMADPLTAPYTDCWTVLANLAGLPAVSVPFGTSYEDGMPVGIMLTGSPGSDGRLLHLAGRIEQSTALGRRAGK